MTLYQWICFPLYGLRAVKRTDYIVIDRHKLHYLKLMERINCAYCGYANGLLAYGLAIAKRTESYWCAIKHHKEDHLGTLVGHDDYMEFGDEDAYQLLGKKENRRS